MYLLTHRGSIAKVGELRNRFRYSAAQIAQRTWWIMTQKHVDIKMILQQ